VPVLLANRRQLSWQRHPQCCSRAVTPAAEFNLSITSFFITQVTLQQNVINKKRIASVEKQHERKKRRVGELTKKQPKLLIESCLKQKPIIDV